MTYDASTADYFNSHDSHYYAERASFIVDTLSEADRSITSVLAAGIGAGGPIEIIRNVIGEASVVGIDISHQSLLAFQGQYEGATPVRGTVTRLPFRSNRFDAATAISLLHHVVGSTPDVSHRLAIRSVREMVRVLRPGGYLFIHEPAYSPQWFADLVFRVKFCASNWSDGARIEVPYIGNIGAPVTAFFEPSDLRKRLEHDVAECRVVDFSVLHTGNRHVLGTVEKREVKVVCRKPERQREGG